MKRYALVKKYGKRSTVEAYLPENYEVIYEGIEKPPWYRPAPEGAVPEWVLVLKGEDVSGWTLDAYVMPRMRQWGMTVEEIDLSHPVMKQVPDAAASPRVEAAVSDWKERFPNGIPSAREIIETFGSWNAALKAAGLGDGFPDDVVLSGDGRFLRVSPEGVVEVAPEDLE